MSETAIVKSIFEYFAKFPKKAGVLELFKRTSPTDQEYIDFKAVINGLTEHSLMPSIEDYIFGTSKKFVQDRIRNLKGKFLYIEYGQAITTEGNIGHQKDSKMFLALTVGFKFSNDNYDAIEESIVMSQILDDLISIEAKIMADSKTDRCYFARLIDFPLERLPLVPHEFLNCIGWTLIFHRKLNIH